MKRRVALIGPGRLGQTVANLLHEAGYDIRAIIGRDPARTLAAARFAGCRNAATTDLARVREGELVMISLPDDQLRETAALLRRDGHLAPEAVLIHFSGIHPAAVLLGDDPQRQVLSLHPLQTFPDAVNGVRSLPGSPFSVEGTPEALPLGEELVRDMGGIPFHIEGGQKALYHAAACLASNYLVTLTAAAGEMMTACGFSSGDALRHLAPLLRSTLNNLTVLGPEGSLTGPIARGDVRTVKMHLCALAEMPPDLQEIYRVLGEKTVKLARRKGTLGEKEGEEILRILGRGALPLEESVPPG